MNGGGDAGNVVVVGEGGEGNSSMGGDGNGVHGAVGIHGGGPGAQLYAVVLSAHAAPRYSHRWYTPRLRA